MMPSSMLQPSPMSTTLAFSSRVVWPISVARILSISALVITVDVVGFPGLIWAWTASGIRTAAASKTVSAVFFIAFLLNISRPSALSAGFTSHLDQRGGRLYIAAPCAGERTKDTPGRGSLVLADIEGDALRDAKLLGSLKAKRLEPAG